MDADEIEAFLALAEELHFTRTARRLHLPPSRVSRLIASLERRVGGALFERTSRRVALTPLGARLRDQAGPAYASLVTALEQASSWARGVDGALRVGCTVTVGGPVINRLAEEFSASHPSCELTLHEVSTWEPYAGLRCGEVDVLINWLALDEPDLVAGPVLEYRDRVLAMRRGHRLAGRDSVSFEDLADLETHSPPYPDKYPAALGDAIIPRVTPSGRPVRRTFSTWSLDDLFALMTRTDLVHPTMAGLAVFQRDDIVLVPIRDMPPMPLGLIWHAAHENARIRALAAAGRRLAPAATPAGSPPPLTAPHRYTTPNPASGPNAATPAGVTPARVPARRLP
jgi:DNA-binding transcriptional LysR family regulator